MTREINGTYYKLVKGYCNNCAFCNPMNKEMCLYKEYDNGTFDIRICFSKRKIWKKIFLLRRRVWDFLEKL